MIEIEDAVMVGAVVLGGVLVCSAIYLLIGIGKYIWGLI